MTAKAASILEAALELPADGRESLVEDRLSVPAQAWGAGPLSAEAEAHFVAGLDYCGTLPRRR